MIFFGGLGVIDSGLDSILFGFGGTGAGGGVTGAGGASSLSIMSDGTRSITLIFSSRLAKSTGPRMSMTRIRM